MEASIFQSFPAWYAVACLALVAPIYFLKNYVFRRWFLSRELPGMRIGILDFWGDANNFAKDVPEKYYNTYFLQVLSAYTQLFRKQTFFSYWFAFVPIIYVVKASAVEIKTLYFPDGKPVTENVSMLKERIADQLIAGTKYLEKSWTYSWLHSWLNTGLLTSHGQKWKTRRKLITPSFHFDILKDFLPVIDGQSRYLVEEVFMKEIEEDWTDITLPITLCALDVICETTLGVSVNAQKNSKSDYVQALMRVANKVMLRVRHPAYFINFLFNWSKLAHEYEEDVKLLHKFTHSVIKQKKAKLKTSPAPKKRKALMDMLLEHHLQKESLTEEDIREEVDTFTFAGHDTTSTGVSWALYLIGLHKDVQNRLHEETDRIFGSDIDRPVTEDDLREMKYMEQVLKESQRLYPSVPMFGRESTSETVLNGFKVPEGVACFVLTYELHRDPEEFPDPEKFDPDRFSAENSLHRHPYAFVPFSAGPRNCIGQRFAFMEEKVIVCNILRNFTLESMEPRDKVLPAPELVLRSSEALKIRIRERKYL